MDKAVSKTNDLVKQVAQIIKGCDNAEYIAAVAIVRLINEREQRYRKMLYDMTSLRDWQTGGYDGAEYSDIVREFEFWEATRHE